MSAQTAWVDREGVLNAAAVVDPRARVRLMATALALSPNFRAWLEANWAIWFEFQKLADAMRLTGRSYYSARAVLHVLRWHRALKDSTEPVLKINNNRSAELARLYNGLVDREFFRTRGE